MSMRSVKGGFLQAHYDLVALGVGAAALVAAVLFAVLGGGVEEEIDEIVGSVGRKTSGASVANVVMTDYAAATNAVRVAAKFSDLPEKAESFLASEKRIVCANKTCGRATPEIRDPMKNLICGFCGWTQEVAKIEVPLDADNDGLPDEWERRYGLNPKDASDAQGDPDGDEFTNLEEFAAKTDPKNPNDHPDYLDSLKIVLPLKETSLPFAFRKAYKIPAGWRCEFFDPSRKDDNGRRGRMLTAVVGNEIVDAGVEATPSGYLLKNYEYKTAQRAIKGSDLTKTVDASEVIVERKRDGKQVKLAIQEGKSVKLAPMDVQATLVYTRGTEKSFAVVPGTEIVLSGSKYKVTEVESAGKGAKVTVENVLHPSQKRTLEALEP